MRGASKRSIAKHAGGTERKYQRLFFPGQRRPRRPYDIGGELGTTQYRGEVKEREEGLGLQAKLTVLSKALQQVERYSHGRYECFAVLHILSESYQYGVVARRVNASEIETCLACEFVAELRGQQKLAS